MPLCFGGALRPFALAFSEYSPESARKGVDDTFKLAASFTAMIASLSPTATSAINRALLMTLICFAVTSARAKG